MRLIDADKLGLTDFEIVTCDGDYKEALKLILSKIDNATTIGTTPVKHGQWVKAGDGGYCSVCKCDMPMFIEDWKWKYCKTPYCPNCGAKMCKGADNEKDIKEED